jgi:uncharacterized protein (TIGR02757 family)
VRGDLVAPLDLFYRELRSRAGGRTGTPMPHGLRFLLPLPGDGAACKRAHLYLRWMVRRDGFDLGLWASPRLAPSRLLLPLDTHVHRIAGYLGLTRRRSPDLLAAREATGWLARIDAADPVSFDWALSRLGILAECVRDPSRSRCDVCRVRPACRVAKLATPERPGLTVEFAP